MITVKKMDVDYHTQVIRETDVKILKENEKRSIGNFDISFGDVEVTHDFLKYKVMLYGKTLSAHKLRFTFNKISY